MVCVACRRVLAGTVHRVSGPDRPGDVGVRGVVVSSEGVKRGKREPRIFTAPPRSFPPLGCGHRAGSINSAGMHGGVDVTIQRNVTPSVTEMFLRPTFMVLSSYEPRVITRVLISP